MMKIQKLIFAVALFGWMSLDASLQAASLKPEWSAALIADSLRQGMLSVVRCEEATFTQNSVTTGRCTRRRVVTILSDQGDSHAVWSTYNDPYRQLGSFDCRIYDATGKELKKVKEKDLSRTEYSEHLMSDGCYFYYDPGRQSSYPYTIEYMWEEKVQKGISTYIHCQPVGDTRQSSEHCLCQVVIPEGDVRTLSRNTHAQWQRIEESGRVTYSITIPPFCGVLDEDLLPSLHDLLPVVGASPDAFSRNGYAGNLGSWEQLGNWALQLWQGRQALPSVESDSVAALTSDLDNDSDKIAALYQYVARRTRYVSIQLGIGGWQPMKAEEVSRTGFGDCKALANYMHGLLQLAGITSYPVIIGTRHNRYLSEYPNFFQNNHCILCVPQESDSLWLDCTAASSIPCGVIPNTLRDHDCILLTPEGARLTRVPNPVPQIVTSAHITIGADLQAQCDAREVDYKGKSRTISKQYGKVLGGRSQLFPLDPYSKIFVPKFRRGSAYPMERDFTVCYVDTLHIVCAEGVELESVADLSDATMLNRRLPLADQPLAWRGEGMLDDWQIEMKRENNGVCIVVVINRRPGSFPASEKEKYVEQCRQLNDRLSAKLIFRKQ